MCNPNNNRNRKLTDIWRKRADIVHRQIKQMDYQSSRIELIAKELKKAYLEGVMDDAN